jgi:cytidylate kinase
VTSTIRTVIAIDGPAASGKSSTAQWVAERLGFRHVDSGSLYRAITATMLRVNVHPESWTSEGVIASGQLITLKPELHFFTTLINDQSVDEEIRSANVTANVSQVAQMGAVRSWVNARVRQVAETYDVVVDGRDIGTAVFPDAPLKIFLVADPWERARRRLTQRLGRGPTDDEVAEETDALVHRDAKDATQTMQARDAVLVDTTHLTQAEQVERIVSLAHAVSHRPLVT